MSRILAIDYGEKNVGLAVSDPLGIIAREFDTLNMSENIFKDLLKVCEDNSIVKIVIGLPLGVNSGKDTEQTGIIRKFSHELAKHIDLPIELYDERFTSVMAKKLPKTSKKGMTKDSLSALYILESYLEYQR